MVAWEVRSKSISRAWWHPKGPDPLPLSSISSASIASGVRDLGALRRGGRRMVAAIISFLLYHLSFLWPDSQLSASIMRVNIDGLLKEV